MPWEGRRLVHSVMHVARKPFDDQFGSQGGKTMVWKNGQWYAPGDFDVRCVMMTGKYFTIGVNGNTSIEQKMWDLGDKLQIHYTQHVRLSYKGQVMDTGRTFQDYGIIGLEDGEPVTVDMTVVNEPTPWPCGDWDKCI